MSTTSILSGMSTSTRLISLLASVAVHAAVLITIPIPFGETDTGTAESESALHVSVQRFEPSDNKAEKIPSQEISDQKPVVQQKEPAKIVETQLESTPKPVVTKTPEKEENPAPAPVAKKILVAKEKEKPSRVINKVKEEKAKPEAKPVIKQKAEAKEIPDDKKEKPILKTAVTLKSAPATTRKGTKTKINNPMQIASAGRESKLTKDYRSKLLRLIEKNKYYPRRARRSGIEGKATVSFIVRKNGEIKNVTIARSSKKSLLDQAAIKTIKRVGHAPPFPRGLKRSQWKFSIPITYALKKR